MKKTRKQILSLVVLSIIFLVGCNNSKKTEEETTTSNSTPTVTTAPTATIAPSAATEESVTAQKTLVLPLTSNDSGKVMIQTVSKSTAYPYNSYIITSSNGEVVVLDPTNMPSKDIIDLNPAAIISTHGHPDHTDANFVSSYDAKTVLYTKEDFDLKDFHVYTIYSSHSGDTISTSNIITVLEVDGIRIAHMGDVGQSKLTEEQLEELGSIDIAFMQFENSYSNMSVFNLKGFNLIEQLNPKIIIPTHYSQVTLTYLVDKYGEITEYDNVLTISKEELAEDTLNVYRILNNHIYN